MKTIVASTRPLSTVPFLVAGVVAGLLPIFLKPLLILAVGAGLVLSVLLIKNPRLGLFLIAVTIPLETVGRIGSITSNLPLTVPKILTLVTLIAWLINLATGKMRFRRLPWMYLLVGFLVAATLSLVGAQEIKYGYEAVLRLTTTVMFFFLVVQLIDTIDVLRWCLVTFIVASTVAASYSLIQRYLPGSVFEFRHGWEEESARRGGVERDIVEKKMIGGVVERSSGFSAHSILLALNIGLLLAPIAAFMGTTPNRAVLKKLFWMGIVVILFASVIVTFARTGFIIAMFCVVLMVWRRLIRITAGKLVAALLILVVLIFMLPEKYVARVLSPRAYTTNSASIKIRLEITKAAIQQFLDHPILGVGYGNRYGIFDYFTAYPDKKHAVTPHNAYVQVASQVGIVGLLPLCLFFWKTHLHMRRSIKVFEALDHRDLARLGNSLHISMLIFLFSGFALDLFDKGMPHCWLITGMCGAFIYLGQEQKMPMHDVSREVINA